jgi:hypothetical protein
MVLKILIAIVAAFAAFIALQPSDYRIARSATIAAPASDVFAQVNDFHKWDAWSPWAKLDPNAKTTFEGPSAGEGAVFAWACNSEIWVSVMRPSAPPSIGERRLVSRVIGSENVEADLRAAPNKIYIVTGVKLRVLEHAVPLTKEISVIAEQLSSERLVTYVSRDT